MAGAPTAGLEGGFLQAVWVVARQSILVIDSWLRGFASPGSASILALKILVKNALGHSTFLWPPESLLHPCISMSLAYVTRREWIRVTK